MKRLSFYSFLCAVLLMSVNVFGQFEGGSGTLADPYQVKTAQQFAAIAGYPNAFFVQIDNITFENNREFPQINFSGIYDGQGYTISANSDKTKPLFGTVTGTITRVTVNMNGRKTKAAILCKTLDGGTISYCNIQGNVTGATAGGIVNTMSSGLVEYCCFTGNVTAHGVYGFNGYAGGICARQNGGEIKGSMVASPSNIHGATLFGLATASGITNEGLSLGSQPQIDVTSCYSQATVTSNGTTNDIASGRGVTTTNSYPDANAGELSGQALADYLNAGLDPDAFGVDNGNVVSRASSLSDPSYNGMGIYVSKQNGNFDVVPTWKYTPSDSDTKQFIISAGHTVTLRNANHISGASITVEDG